MNRMKKALSLVLSLVMTLVMAGPMLTRSVAAAGSKNLRGSQFPTVFVHGMMGWGSYEPFHNVIDYWGATSGSMMDYLNGQGYRVYAASTGALSSAWDRACELYAQLTGTRTDYGAAHAKKYGHERYGEDFTGRALIPGFQWSSKNKLNLVGHSFGAPTIRLLADLMKDGNAAETAAAKKAGTKVSPLFTGGKGDWIFSLTSLHGPNNGSTFLDSAPLSTVGAFELYALWAYALGITDVTAIHNFRLEHFGVTVKDSETFGSALLRILQDGQFYAHNDSCWADMDIDRQVYNNKYLDLNPDIFYFSFYGNGVSSGTGLKTPDPTDFVVMQLYEGIIGNYTGSTDGAFADGFGPYAKTVRVPVQTLGKDWQPNDGMVNVLSGRVPFHRNASGKRVYDKHRTYKPGTKLLPGIWNVMPEDGYDHFGVIGGVLSENAADTRTFYRNLMELISSCKRTA